jgi:hypothetical protein
MNPVLEVSAVDDDYDDGKRKNDDLHSDKFPYFQKNSSFV